ncbi:hypothetical protein IWQ57_000628 [Coemansia nantahalensis]|uniref:Uncharacterized protein n=1 Tax=Coemansia nantahalensis TaxID=2789366 RepID=A0ACC1K7I6_9FUNG|nr:hypothetical protein IWQ57_000628 [Coemansia nantahalensis]
MDGAVLQGLRSLDDLERLGAQHPDSSRVSDRELLAELHGPSAGVGSFSEAELSAALEHICWDSLGMPLVDPSELSSHPAAGHADSPISSAAPTPAPAPTPVAAVQIHIPAPIDAQEQLETQLPADGVDDDDDDDGNPLELEELSLFSLFLADMKAFEAFLSNLSLNQLRQCAATVNSVLVQRESGLGSARRRQSADVRYSREPGPPPAPASPPPPPPVVQAAQAAADPDPTAGGTHGREGCPPPPIVSLLREWLPLSTVECVITALQTANLDILGPAPRPPERVDSARTDTQPAEAGGPAGEAQHPDRHAAPLAAVHSHEHGEAVHASDPQLHVDGEDTPWLSFVYAQKGKPRRHRIRIDIERAPLAAIPSSFRNNNCVYPRANCHKMAYTGNRWCYETECNGIGWKLAFLNQELLATRRGLLQTAVNNYRSIVAGRKSRRIARMEKAERSSTSMPAGTRPDWGAMSPGTEGPAPIDGKRPLHLADPEVAAAAIEKRARTGLGPSDASGAQQQQQQPLTPPPTASGDGFVDTAAPQLPRAGSTPSLPSSASAESAKCLLISAYVNSKFTRIRVYIDFGSIDAAAVDQQFRHDHAVFPRALNAARARYGSLQGRWEFEVACNELAWRLAWLNKARLRGRKPLIQKCLDAYRERFSTPPWGLLICYDEQMGGSVSSRFFDYWKPRPGSRRLGGEATDTTSDDDRQQHEPLALPDTSSGSGSGGASAPACVSPMPVPVLSPREPAATQAPPQVAAIAGPESSVRTCPVRPQQAVPPSTAAGPRPAPVHMAKPAQQGRPALPAMAARPQRPATLPRPAPAAGTPGNGHPPLPRPRPPIQPRPQPGSAQARPAGSPATRPASRGPGAAGAPGPAARPAMRPPTPGRPSGPVSPATRPPRTQPATPSRPPGASARPPARPSPGPRPPSAGAPPARPPATQPGRPVAAAGVHPRPPAVAPEQLPVQQAVGATPAARSASQRSVKAQAAADVLTDVLRRLHGHGAAPAPPKSAQAAGSGADDIEPLDAKVAELERLIFEIQHN